MKPGDIVLIRFPQTDLKPGKLHPALVVANAPGRYTDIFLAQISSRIYQAIQDFDEIIDPSDIDYYDTGLKVRSAVRLARLATVEPSIIIARLGHISPERLQTIRKKLVNWFQS